MSGIEDVDIFDRDLCNQTSFSDSSDTDLQSYRNVNGVSMGRVIANSKPRFKTIKMLLSATDWLSWNSTLILRLKGTQSSLNEKKSGSNPSWHFGSQACHVVATSFLLITWLQISIQIPLECTTWHCRCALRFNALVWLLGVSENWKQRRTPAQHGEVKTVSRMVMFFDGILPELSS